MTSVRDVCRHVRSKNAGPYWVTIDLFFDSDSTFDRHANDRELWPEVIARLYGVDRKQVKCFPVRDLHVLKISYPRSNAQGGEVERDMHCGQQYVRLLDVKLD